MYENNTDKHSLIEEFFALRGSTNVHKLTLVKRKIVEYLETTKPDAHLIDIIKIIEWVIYDTSHGNIKYIYDPAASVAERLEAKETLDILDIRIAPIVVGHLKGYRDVHNFAQKILMELEKYKNESFYTRTKFFIHYNATPRFLWSKFFELDYKKPSAELTELTDLFTIYKLRIFIQKHARILYISNCNGDTKSSF